MSALLPPLDACMSPPGRIAAVRSYYVEVSLKVSYAYQELNRRLADTLVNIPRQPVLSLFLRSQQAQRERRLVIFRHV